MINVQIARNGSLIVRWVIFAALVFSLMATLAPAATPSAGATTCPEGYVLGPDKEVVNSDGSITRVPGDCVPAPQLNLQGDILGLSQNDSDENDDSPEITTDIGVVSTAEAVGGPAYVTVHKYDCSGDVDWGSQGLEQLRNQCGPAPGIGFNLVNIDADGAQNYAAGAQSDADGLAFWMVETPGAVTISESVPDGYGDPIVFCGLPNGLGNLSLLSSAGGVITHPLAYDQQLYCDWFNIATTTVEDPYVQGVDGAFFTLEKYGCIAGFDAYTADFDGIAANCSAPLANVEFMSLQGDVVIRSGATDAAGGLDFGEVPAVSLVTQEVVPDGYGAPVVICETTPAGGNQSDLLPMTVENGNQITYDFTAGETVRCLWFNVPETGDAGEDDGSLTVIKLVCPPLEGDGPPQSGQVRDGSLLLLRQEGEDPQAPDVELCSEFEATPGEGFTFDLTLDDQDLGSKNTDATGQAVWTGIGEGFLVLTEQIPDGYGEPYFYCHAGRNPIVAEFTGEATIPHPGASDIICIVVNVPEEYDDGGVVIHKWECDHDPGYAVTMPVHLEAAQCELQNGVEFTLSYGIDTEITKSTGEVETGVVGWNGVPAGEITIRESLPEGYGDPVVYCTSEMPEGSFQLAQSVESTGVELTVPLGEGENLVCHWINIPDEDSTITIYKYTCPAGYDLYADGANPEYDCTELTNGVEFWLTGDNYDDGAITGNYAPGAGAATWGQIPAGGYTIVETPPAGTQSAFVSRCEGNSIPMIQNFPLSTGYELYVETAPGDHVVCYWYNVPAPDWGSVTVIKYACPTKEFISPEDCQIYEGGVEFELLQYAGSGSNVAGTGTTNSNGYLTWTGLEDGAYELVEKHQDWCYAEASRTDASGNILVTAGAETKVWVYNCGVIVPVKPAVKYPNTGVGATQAENLHSAAPVSEEGAHLALPHNRLSGVLDSRIAASLAGGSRPVRIAIESIGVGAEIEVLEIVDGAFQAPTTSEKVAWYKETGRPGSAGNMVLAGHLNYWGDPEGVFFALDRVEVGDVIEVTDQEGIVREFQVVTVEQLDATTETLQQITAPTEESTLTLITCGGTWDAGSQTYLQRTVVRAEEI